MPLSAAERSRLYRQRVKQNPERYQQYLVKEKLRYKTKLEKGLLTSINGMSERAKRIQRKEWRKRKQRQREQEKKHEEMSQRLLNMTPPLSPDTSSDHVAEALPPPTRNSQKRKQQGLKLRCRAKSKAYRMLEKVQTKLENQTRLMEKYKKRLQRANTKKALKDSPRTKTNRLLAGQRVNTEVRKTLIFHNVLVKNMKDNIGKMKRHKTKQMIAKLISANVLKKYRLQEHSKLTVGFTHRQLKGKRKLNANLVSSRERVLRKIQKRISEFFVREDNSKMAPGKKATATKYKQRKQVHILSDSLRNLHLKYLAENENCKVSYSLFCRLKPFYIRKPTAGDRKTCECKKHENLKFKAIRLKQLKIIKTDNLHELAQNIVCDISSKSCMYRECVMCSEKQVPVEERVDGMVEWYQWNSKRVERFAHGSSEAKVVSVTVKDREKGTVENLISDFQIELSKTCRHLYNITHQFLAIRKLKSELTENDILLHIDFSENYNCKYETEIQSMHFGPNQRQISLHTGVVYSKDFTKGFCTMSDCLKHSPPSIWAHLKPVLKYAMEQIPNAERVYFLSDGPTTQYRSKHNFFLLSSVPFDLGFKSVNWSFLEAGHGKGAPDGIGAVIKREADKAVLHGQDITDADSLHKCLIQRTSIQLYIVKDTDITAFEKDMPDKLSPLPGTMKVHQLYTETRVQASHRVLSCFCSFPDNCSCFNPEKWESKHLAAATSSPKTAENDLSIRDDKAADMNAVHPTDERRIERDEAEVDVIDESLIGKFCVVKYEEKPYPGIIEAVDVGEVEVNVMHTVGDNRFFWPLIQDVLWYSADNLLRIIPPPQKVGSRHMQIDRKVWQKVKSQLDM